MKYRTQARKGVKLVRKSWWDDGVDEEQDLVLPPHDFTVYEPEDTSTGLYDATGVEIHRMKETIGFLNFDEIEQEEEEEQE